MRESPQLVSMVCNIADFFKSETDEAAAVSGIVNHIEKFWDPRMRRKLIASFPTVKDQMPPIARTAVEQLMTRASSG